MNSSNVNFWSWFLQRISAVILVIGLFVHYWVTHFIIERPVNFVEVQARLISPWWITFDTILLLCVIYHGLNGVWGIYLDFNPKEKYKKITAWILSITGILTFFIGFYILFPFRDF